TGLASNNLVTLSLNSGDQYVTVNSNSTFEFNIALIDGAGYDVTVAFNPSTPNQTCVINNGTGSVSGINVSDIEISCQIIPYFIGGYVIGLIPDNHMVLQNNLSDDLVLSQEGAFVFATPIDDQESYDISI